MSAVIPPCEIKAQGDKAVFLCAGCEEWRPLPVTFYGNSRQVRGLCKLCAGGGLLGSMGQMPVTWGRVQKRERKDGWPLCPRCGDDELFSTVMMRWQGEEPRPTLDDCYAEEFECYCCHWRGKPSEVEGC